jgi:hypothetical protein
LHLALEHIDLCLRQWEMVLDGDPLDPVQVVWDCHSTHLVGSGHDHLADIDRWQQEIVTDFEVVVFADH